MSDNGELMNELTALTKRSDISSSMKGVQQVRLQYETAMKMVLNRIDYLGKAYQLQYDRALIDSVQSRMKKPESILEKMERKGSDLTPDGIKKTIHDIAGIRVIVPFLDDVDELKKLIISQPDFRITKVKDYVKHPKPNGYQSLHLIMEVPIYVDSNIQVTEVELQIRTIAMNFWASLEHQLNYKKNVAHKDEIVQTMTDKAKLITKLDYEMNDLKRRIWADNGQPKDD
ncbi:GTP pyrophosphokinase [Lactobacillus selangorensis]|uniref:GTP pyrophosphokinase n=1 Tax=Lactobacillus selangorensis TaxID=81857 RepID=A0A0R2FJB3_9LACO|nr:GTP pyrophosphokinase [Lactobacillus selangorensis]KRN28754.1 GTP pyrophosphokinase [Lactobacillus selangorensis]KRN32836.1 GTP pyrophosphokinase [Lactobacillus selangorensis]